MTVISMDSLHTEEPREALQKNLRKFRTAAGFSQEELSQLLGMNRATYTYYETGKTTPSISVLKLLAKIYNVSLMELLMDESEAGQLRDSSRSDSFDHIKYIYDLSADERLLVGIFRSATPEEQEEILQSANDICGLKK